jgi:hypothetical protein
MWDFEISSGGGFFEDFDDGVADNWIDDGSGTWSVPVPPGVYRSTGNQGDWFRYSYYQEYFSDFTYEADIRRTQGDPYYAQGILFRGDGTFNNFYCFQIDTTGYYLIWKMVGGEYYLMIPEWTYSDSLNQGIGVWNTLKVVCNGSNFEFYCNDSLVETLSDSQFSSGKVGLEMYDAYEVVNITEFDNAQLNLSATVSTEAKKATAIPASLEEAARSQ